jgi:hypothetical protein
VKKNDRKKKRRTKKETKKEEKKKRSMEGQLPRTLVPSFWARIIITSFNPIPPTPNCRVLSSQSRHE